MTIKMAIKLTQALRSLILETDWGGVSATKGAFRIALQTLIDKVRELEDALDRAHKVFGAESDKLKKEFSKVKGELERLDEKKTREALDIWYSVYLCDYGWEDKTTQEELLKIIQKFGTPKRRGDDRFNYPTSNKPY